ncbi:Verru_Chthon cassette protein D [Verrucomicrobiales bacterium BCK34]|nr:Verru_Chthon cassette protein D [Verrucomicrobiales bacterium BCK34]
MNIHRHSGRKAFSLIEMMVVLGVVGLLLAFAAPNLFSLLTSSTLSGEGTVLRNQFTYAQQIAVSKSSDVEVRFFKYADESAAQLDERFRAYQLYQFDREGNMVPVSSFFRIKTPVAVHEDRTTLLNTGASSGNQNDRKYGFIAPYEGVAEAPVGSGGTQVPTKYVAFRFRPDGSTDLPFRTSQNDTWYLTLVQGEGALAESDPANYVCLQVNSYNGQVTEFRPQAAAN